MSAPTTQQALACLAIVEDAYYGGEPNALIEAEAALATLRLYLEARADADDVEAERG